MNIGHKPPRNWRELHAFVMANSSVFPRQLALLADFALHHPDIMAFGTCASIARRAGVSATTVCRLADVLGYGSFRDLRKLFRDDLAHPGVEDGRRWGVKPPAYRGTPSVYCQGRS